MKKNLSEFHLEVLGREAEMTFLEGAINLSTMFKQYKIYMLIPTILIIFYISYNLYIATSVNNSTIIKLQVAATSYSCYTQR